MMTIDAPESDDSPPADVAWLAGFRQGRCPACGQPRAAKDGAAAEELARGHARVCKRTENHEGGAR